MAHCNVMICQQVMLPGDAEWPKVADAVIEAHGWGEKGGVSRDGALEVHHVLPCEEQPIAADQKKKGIPPALYVLRLKQLHVPAKRIDLQHGCRLPYCGRHIGDKEV